MICHFVSRAEFWQVKVGRIEEERPWFWSDILSGSVQELHEAGADAHGNSHDDALADPIDGVLLSVVGCIEQVVGGFLEGGQHQDRLLHFCQAVTGDTQHLTTTRHQVGQQGDVPRR